MLKSEVVSTGAQIRAQILEAAKRCQVSLRPRELCAALADIRAAEKRYLERLGPELASNTNANAWLAAEFGDAELTVTTAIFGPAAVAGQSLSTAIKALVKLRGFPLAVSEPEGEPWTVAETGVSEADVAAVRTAATAVVTALRG